MHTGKHVKHKLPAPNADPELICNSNFDFFLVQIFLFNGSIEKKDQNLHFVIQKSRGCVPSSQTICEIR